MSIGEYLNGRGKPVGIGLGLAAIALAAFLLYRGAGANGGRSERAFYTVDDGQTWFVDDAAKAPPFQHKGATAVRCFVFQNADGTKSVGYLQKYTDAAKARLEAATQPVRGPAAAAGMLVKRPGDMQWLPADSVQGMTIVRQAVSSKDNPGRVPVHP